LLREDKGMSPWRSCALYLEKSSGRNCGAFHEGRKRGTGTPSICGKKKTKKLRVPVIPIKTRCEQKRRRV